MSLESKIDLLTNTLIAVNNTLAALMAQVQQGIPAPQVALTATPAPQAPAPVQAAPEMPTFAPPAPQPAAMPGLPTFAAPAPQPAALPFSDNKGLVDFVMGKYKELEAKAPGSGAAIQNVLTSLGIGNINETKPEQYAALYNGVVAL